MVQSGSAAEPQFLPAGALRIVRREYDGFGEFPQPFARRRVEDHEPGFAVAVFVLDRRQTERGPVVVQVVNQTGAGRGDRRRLYPQRVALVAAGPGGVSRAPFIA